jgi:hypothetical protein
MRGGTQHELGDKLLENVMGRQLRRRMYEWENVIKTDLEAVYDEDNNWAKLARETSQVFVDMALGS